VGDEESESDWVKETGVAEDEGMENKAA